MGAIPEPDEESIEGTDDGGVVGSSLAGGTVGSLADLVAPMTN